MDSSEIDDRHLAVVGLACRLPGAATPEAFWRLLVAGEEAVRFWNPEELEAAGVPAAALADPRFVPAGAIVDGTELFDPAFFGFNQREAEIMDPQHRIFLQCAWEALERAAIDPERFDGLIGVYASAGANTYAWRNLRPHRELVAALGEFRLMVGNDKDFLPAQVAYRLNLKGPAVAVQTACSSSLVAVHLACQSLLAYDCDVALAGGVALSVPQKSGYWYDEGGILSPSGHCQPFDADAAGTTLGEGAGVVVLRRLRDALENGDPILALVLGSGVNNDGSMKIGFTAPSEEGQAEVIAMAQAVARVEPGSIGYLEAHGTGTALGDPIEVAALTRVFRHGTGERQFCALGALKGSIGHLDAAAGVAGMIKAVLAVERGTIPGNPTFRRPNPKLELEAGPFYVPTEARPWNAALGPRRAGVSSFGIGGTNAHVVLGEGPARVPSGPARAWQLLPLSARSPGALERLGGELAAHLEASSELALADVATTLQLGRRALPLRRAVVVASRDHALEALRQPLEAPPVAAVDGRPVFFLFPGQGAQHAGMAQGLVRDEPRFRELLEECAAPLEDPSLGGLAGLLLGPAEELGARLACTRFAQPALFLLELALARLWREWGVEPAGMAGHSLGEYVAACLAGVISPADALSLVVLRGRLMEALPPGAMLSVALPAEELRSRLGGGLAFAAANSPGRSVASGPIPEVEALAERLAREGVETRRLHTSHAFHSPMMEPVLEPLRRRLAGVELRAPELPYLSNTSGTWITEAEATSPDYWLEHLLRPVRFADNLAELAAVDDGVLLEVGPGHTLITFAGQHPEARERLRVASLPHPREQAEEAERLLSALGRLWCAGVRVAWEKLSAGEERRKLALPTYPFERRRCWIDPPASAGLAAPAAAPAEVATEAVLGAAPLAGLDELESKVAALWQEQLGRAVASGGDNFFELGGDSLLATRVVTRLGELFGVALPLASLFEAPTVAGLAGRLRAARGGSGAEEARALALPQIVPDLAHRFEPFPLNDQQQAYWVGRNQGFDLGNVATHIYQEIESDVLDLERFEELWNRMIERHDGLRLVVLADGRQQVLREVPRYAIEVADLREFSEAETERALAVIRDELSHQKLVPERWPLFELRASRLAGGKVRLHLSVDGLILDGWSCQILFIELVECYLDPEHALPPLELSVRDYVLATAALRETHAYQRSRDYWLARLEDLPPGPQLPMVIQPSALEEPKFVRFEAWLEPELWAELKGRIFEAGLTPNSLLLAAYAEVLGRFSKSPRFTVNVPRFNRLPLHPQVDLILGEFASFTLVSVDRSRDASITERARELQGQLWTAVDHGLFTGVEILRELRRLSGSAFEAMMPVVFTCDPLGETGAEEGGLIVPEELGRNAGGVSQTAQVWLDNQVSQQGGRLMVVWDAVASLFPEGLLAEMFEAYRGLLERLARDPEAWQERRLELLSEEHRRWLESRNDTSAPVPEERAQDGFFAMAAAFPERPAVITERRTLSYGELASIANRLGRLLRQAGARPNTLVAVVMEKGWEQAAAVLGILASGAAYLPIDALVPRERLAQLLAQGEVEIVLTQSRLDAALSWPEGVLRLPLDTLDLSGVEDSPLAPVQGPDDLAYVIFTSGSTGRPKGAMLAQRGVANMVRSTNRHWAVGPEDRAIALTALHHDLSVYDLFGLWAAGGALVIPDADRRLDPAHWSELILAHRVTLWNTVPSILEMLLRWADGRAERLGSSLRLAILGGDWVPLGLPGRLRSLVPGAQVLSIGGPTETTVWNIWYPVGEIDPAWKSIPYGRPFENNRYYLLDERLEPCPRWVPGMMYCAGVQLALGYWRDPERTAASFGVHPATGERLYKTGDLGRWRDDGNIEFLGREDFQVKIQGHRIELGEIETALGRLPGVRQAIVLAREDEPGVKRLAAYVVATEGPELAAAELRRQLREQLPEYMVPAAFVLLPALPLTSNGKVDRGRLPAPELGRREATAAAGGAPRTDLERQLGGAWSEVLGRSDFGLGDNFFDLGGNSFLMIQVQGKLREALGRELTVAELFEHTTLASLAEYLSRGEEASPELERGRERAGARRGAVRDRRAPR